MDAACINPVPSQALRGQQKHYLKYQTVITGVILWGGGGMFNCCRSSTVKNKEDIWRVKLYMK